MAKYNKNAQPDVYFVNYDLRPEEKKALKKVIDEQAETVFDWLEKAIDGGYAVTVKKDDYNDCIGCFMRQTDPNGKNSGFILTGRGKNAFNAIAGCLYRHGVLFQEEWDAHRGKQGATDDD